MSSVTGTQSDARFETSAALAEVEASNVKLSNQVEQNAENYHGVAEQAAHAAQAKGVSPTVAVGQLETDLSRKTETAAAEGQVNVNGYVAQAQNAVNSAINSASSYVPESVSSAFGTTKAYAVPAANQALAATQSAIETAKPYVQSAVASATPYVQSATTTVTQAVTGKPTEVQLTTAPLEAGSTVVDTPYPSADKTVPV